MMTIGGNYPAPVTVNGFLCRNCTDVDYAKKHIDPAHPKSGPYGVNAKEDPSIKNTPLSEVVFGGNLASLNAKQSRSVTSDAPKAPNGDEAATAASATAPGTQLDVSA